MPITRIAQICKVNLHRSQLVLIRSFWRWGADGWATNVQSLHTHARTHTLQTREMCSHVCVHRCLVCAHRSEAYVYFVCTHFSHLWFTQVVCWRVVETLMRRKSHLMIYSGVSNLQVPIRSDCCSLVVENADSPLTNPLHPQTRPCFLITPNQISVKLKVFKLWTWPALTLFNECVCHNEQLNLCDWSKSCQWVMMRSHAHAQSRQHLSSSCCCLTHVAAKRDRAQHSRSSRGSTQTGYQQEESAAVQPQQLTLDVSSHCQD